MLDPNGLFSPQQLQEEQAKQSLLQQTLASPIGDNMLTALRYSPRQVAPQLQFATNANSIPEGIAQGLGNAINNAFQIRAMNRQVQQQENLFNLAKQRDLAEMAERQQKQELAQQQARDLAERQGAFINTLTPQQQIQARALIGDDAGFRNLVQSQYDLTTGMAEGQNEARKKIGSLETRENFYNERFPQQVGTLTPQQQNYREALDLGVYDSVTERERQAKASTVASNAATARIQALAAPTVTQQQVEENEIKNQRNRISLSFERLNLPYKIDNAIADWKVKGLNTQESIDKFSRMQQAKQVAGAFYEKLGRGEEVTPEELLQVTNTLNYLKDLDFGGVGKDIKEFYGLKQDDKIKPEHLGFMKISPSVIKSRQQAAKDGVRLFMGQHRITSPYGLRSQPVKGASTFHEGIDLAYSFGEPVEAPKSGVVRLKPDNGGYGNTVEIDHGGGYVTTLNHLDNFGSLKDGQVVNAGDIIGAAGQTGVTTGPHVHLELKHNGRAVDPTGFFTENIQEVNQAPVVAEEKQKEAQAQLKPQTEFDINRLSPEEREEYLQLLEEKEKLSKAGSTPLTSLTQLRDALTNKLQGGLDQSKQNRLEQLKNKGTIRSFIPDQNKLKSDANIQKGRELLESLKQRYNA